jgi:hypothetical protein
MRRPVTPVSREERRDALFGAIFAGCGFVAFALSFTLFSEDGRPVLFGVLVCVCIVCVLLAQQKWVVVASLPALFLVRVVWALMSGRL